MCTMDDVPGLIDTIKEYLSYATYIPLLPEEFNPSIEGQQKLVGSFIEQENSLLLLAIYENKIIGNIDFTGSTRQIMKHTAIVGMGLLSEWQNCGVGTILMQEGIVWARQNEVLEKLWLQVYNSNAAGLALYRKMGFKENGTIEGFFKQGEKYEHNIIMSLDVRVNSIVSAK